jgi:(E)-4-hydroxy-3-methylbut-2-enyl-diphosphate synthase
VGPLVIGGNAPVLVQSMTTTTPDRIDDSLAQIAALRATGCPLVRLAVPSLAAARALPALRAAMRARGLDLPLIADVHFDPRIALVAAQHVEKVRINPGNFAADPAAARDRLAPLVEVLRARGAALRIGVNHGSLPAFVSDTRGHGPEALVHLALEYLRLCRELDFDQVVVSIKASNPALMIAANRRLAERLAAEGFATPIHLGVTEAGLGSEGTLRSMVGIGPLLLDGIGDTIRVSLTGDPVTEIPVCHAILRAVAAARETPRPFVGAPLDIPHPGTGIPIVEFALDEAALPRTIDVTRAGIDARADALADTRADAPPDACLDLPPVESVRLRLPDLAVLPAPGGRAASVGDLRARTALYFARAGIPLAHEFALWVETAWEAPAVAAADTRDPMSNATHPARLALLNEPGIHGLSLRVSPDSISARLAQRAPTEPLRSQARALAEFAAASSRAKPDASARLHLRWHIELPDALAVPERDPASAHARLGALGALGAQLAGLARDAGCDLEVISVSGRPLCGASHALHAAARAPAALHVGLPSDPDEAAVTVGALLIEGLADAIVIDLATADTPDAADALHSEDAPHNADAARRALRFADALLQATRRRLTHAEFISCPGCGRLRFDLTAAVTRLKTRLARLAGVKIAVMGCVVNGPGEMADADFGYVGSGENRVDLYAGRTRVRRGLTPQAAEDALYALVVERGAPARKRELR